MEQQELEKQPARSTQQLSNVRRRFKKWWLLPMMIILITIPTVLVLTLTTQKTKPEVETPISQNIFNYEPLEKNEFIKVTERYSKIKQQYIASVAKVMDIYLTPSEWNSLSPQITGSMNSMISQKIINNLSSKLRLIGLIDSSKELSLIDSKLDIEISDQPDNNQVSFTGLLKYDSGNESLPIGGKLNLSREIFPPLKIINNDTMPRLLQEMNQNRDLKGSINWNMYGFWYGLETIGDKEANGKWVGLQKVDLKNFNEVALGWFIDTLKTANLITYDAGFDINNLNFYVNGWNPQKLYLKNKTGITQTSDAVILTADNMPWNDSSNQATSIVSTIEFGWKNPFNGNLITVESTGAYILGPVDEYYGQA